LSEKNIDYRLNKQLGRCQILDGGTYYHSTTIINRTKMRAAEYNEMIAMQELHVVLKGKGFSI